MPPFSALMTPPASTPLDRIAERGGTGALLARAVCSSAPTTAPSPIAAPTRLTDPGAPPPAPETPGTLVSSGSGRPDPLFDRPDSDGTSDPVNTKFLLS